MKLITSLASFAAVLYGVAAAPNPDGWKGWNNGCWSRAYIENLIAQEIVFLQHLDVAAATAAAYNIIDPNIAEYGDSINSLRMDPLGTQVENSADTYISDTVGTPPIPQIDSLSLTVECNQFVWQWRFYGIGPGPNPWIQGFTLGKVNAAGKIYYQYVEFNSLAWAENSGYTVTPPTTGPFAAPSGT